MPPPIPHPKNIFLRTLAMIIVNEDHDLKPRQFFFSVFQNILYSILMNPVVKREKSCLQKTDINTKARDLDAGGSRVSGSNPAKDPIECASISQSDTWQQKTKKFWSL